jgi:hypothetical protein
VAALEALLALPTGPSSPAPSASALQEEVTALRKALSRANYRILHLTKAYDSLVSSAPAPPK